MMTQGALKSVDSSSPSPSLRAVVFHSQRPSGRGSVCRCWPRSRPSRRAQRLKAACSPPTSRPAAASAASCQGTPWIGRRNTHLLTKSQLHSRVGGKSHKHTLTNKVTTPRHSLTNKIKSYKQSHTYKQRHNKGWKFVCVPNLPTARQSLAYRSCPTPRGRQCPLWHWARSAQTPNREFGLGGGGGVCRLVGGGVVCVCIDKARRGRWRGRGRYTHVGREGERKNQHTHIHIYICGVREGGRDQSTR